jgi:hypothetical protein
VIEPVFTPAAAGVPVTVNVALPLAAIGPVGVTAVTVKPVVGVTEVIVNGAVPLFLIVNVYAGVAAVVTGAEPTEIAGVLLFATTVAVASSTDITGTLPVTVMFTLYEGVTGSFDTTVIVPGLMPVTAGIPEIVNVAIAPVKISPVGVNGVSAKPADAVTEVIFKGATPVFLILIVYVGVDATPTADVPILIAGVLLLGITVESAVLPSNTFIIGTVAVPVK